MMLMFSAVVYIKDREMNEKKIMIFQWNSVLSLPANAIKISFIVSFFIVI